MTFVTNLGTDQPRTTITVDNACQTNRTKCDCWFKRFVKENVPTDEKTCVYIIVVIGFLMSFYTPFICFWMTHISPLFDDTLPFLILGYLFLAAAISIQFYYGKIARDRKQQFFWVSLKIIESVAIIMVFLISLANWRWESTRTISCVIAGLIQFPMLFIVMKAAYWTQPPVIPEKTNEDDAKFAI